MLFLGRSLSGDATSNQHGNVAGGNTVRVLDVHEHLRIEGGRRRVNESTHASDEVVGGQRVAV